MKVPVEISQEERFLGPRAGRLLTAGLLAGGGGAVASVVLALAERNGWASFFYAYLLAYAYVLSIALGALFFVMLHHLTHAGWSVVVRRLAEGLAATLPMMALLFVPVLFGLHQLYHWSGAGASGGDALLRWKAPYLNTPFFIARWVVYLGVWAWLARFFVRRSVAQDGSGDVQLTVAMQRRAAPGMFLYAFTVTFAAIDLLMSLEPRWYSTIFGVYYFAGGVMATFAALIVMAWLVQKAGLLRHVITVEHYHDLGKFMFAFVVFWAYIGFSQYMLIWYGNIPEETSFYLTRQTGGWGWVGLALVFGQFLLPFVALLSRTPKRRGAMLAGIAAWLLAMHWVDIFWLVMPQASSTFLLSGLDVTVSVALGGLVVARVALALRRCSLVAEQDPRLLESLSFENA
jgi:hypothetical protein